MLKSLLQKPLLQRLQLAIKFEKSSFISLCEANNTKSNLANILNFHTSPKSRIVVVSHENNFAFNVVSKIGATPIRNLKVLNNEVDNLEEFNSVLNQNWRTSSASEIVETFKNVKNFCIQKNIDLSDKRFDNLIDGLMDTSENLSANHITELLSCVGEMPLTKSYDAHNFHDLWSCLDDICCWKMVDWDIDTSLKIATLWYQLHLGMHI